MTEPPSPTAVNSMDGFDDLPREFRDLFNYHSENLVSGNRPCRQIADAIARYGAPRLLALSTQALDKAAANPDRFNDTRRRNRNPG